MTASPLVLAEPPDADLLSDVLKAVRLTGSVFLNGRFSAPFGVVSPAQWDGTNTLAHLRHASVFHLIARGQCDFESAGGARFELREGDVVLLPFTAEHRFWCGDHNGFAEASRLLQPGPVPGVGLISHGGGGAETRFVCGYLESAELLPAPFFRALPPVLIERTRDDPGSAIATISAAIIREVDGEPRPGLELMLGRMMELLFLEVLRRHAARLPSSASGVLAASRDPLVSRALTLLHRAAARRWTVEELAAEVASSRTVLNERFRQVMGMAPIEYLTSWRMQLASDRLRASREPLARIAEEVGYESEASFSRAFRRIVGVSPGAWRDGVAEAEPALG